MSYKKLLDGLEFSFSSLHQYEQCPYSFYLNKIDGTEINEGNFFSDIGSFVHEIIAKVLTGELSIDDSINYFIDNYDNYVVYKTKESTMKKKYDEAIDFLAEFDMSILDNYEILGVEKEVHFEIGGYKFVGFIDLIIRDKQTEKIILVDHKSSGHFLGKNGKPLKNQQENFESYKKQMYMYSRAIHDEYGEYPEIIIWDHFFEKKFTIIPFEKDDYDKTMEWAVDTIKEIYKDRKFECKRDWFYCSNLCGFGGSCCYKDGEEE